MGTNLGSDRYDAVLLKKGAEANLYLREWYGRRVVVKKRISKKYRLSELDKQIRTYRTIHEPQLIHRAKKAGVPTPTIFLVDVGNAEIYMEYVEGKQLKKVLNSMPVETRWEICGCIGELVGKLHRNGIIHGDLTTSNMILTPEDRIVLVDFGLGEFSHELEARGVDLHLLKRAFESVHFEFAEECFRRVMDKYAQIVGFEEAEKVLEKVREIEKRGRYVSERRKID
ncbi:MAG TPA: Kae1-associated serine/threonine protein kinase [Candidatus Bathyarchaeota archaeon]|nr:Kae1-associated serine/threonine protein kinase [Candidatus Bathyarchaeota archaeon]